MLNINNALKPDFNTVYSDSISSKVLKLSKIRALILTMKYLLLAFIFLFFIYVACGVYFSLMLGVVPFIYVIVLIIYCIIFYSCNRYYKIMFKRYIVSKLVNSYSTSLNYKHNKDIEIVVKQSNLITGYDYVECKDTLEYLVDETSISSIHAYYRTGTRGEDSNEHTAFKGVLISIPIDCEFLDASKLNLIRDVIYDSTDKVEKPSISSSNNKLYIALPTKRELFKLSSKVKITKVSVKRIWDDIDYYVTIVTKVYNTI